MFNTFIRAVKTAPVTRSVANFHSSRPTLGLEEFFTNQQPGKVGRHWSSAELRLKSTKDLEKLWFVLLKEKNMLSTYKHLCQQTQTTMKNSERFLKVQKSMSSIKQVVGERRVEFKIIQKDSAFLQNREKIRKLRRDAKDKEKLTKPKYNLISIQDKNRRRKSKGAGLSVRSTL